MILAGSANDNKTLHGNQNIYANYEHQSVHVSAFYDALVALASSFNNTKFSHRTFCVPADDDLYFMDGTDRNRPSKEFLGEMFMLIDFTRFSSRRCFRTDICIN
jgi:hypothetical protein